MERFINSQPFNAGLETRLPLAANVPRMANLIRAGGLGKPQARWPIFHAFCTVSRPILGHLNDHRRGVLLAAPFLLLLASLDGTELPEFDWITEARTG